MKKTSQNETSIDSDLQQAAADQYAMAQDVARLGYQPNRGVTIAGFTPMQQAAMDNTNQGAAAFGMAAPASPMVGMPATQTSASGIQGYSTGADYDQMVNRLPQGYRESIASFFADPNQRMERTQPVNTHRNPRGKK